MTTEAEGTLLHNAGTLLYDCGGRRNATTQCRNTTAGLRKPTERYYTMQEHYCMTVEAEGTLLHNAGTLLQDYGGRRNATTQCRNTTAGLWKPKERYLTMQEHYCRTMEEGTLLHSVGPLLAAGLRKKECYYTM